MYTFPRYLIFFSVIEVIGTPSIDGVLLLTLPSIITKLLLFSGLIESPAHFIFSTSLSNKYLVCTKFSVLVAISSMNKLALTCLCPDEVVGPFVSSLTDITNIVIDRANRITLSVQPVIIPFSTLCQSVVNSLVVNLMFILP